MLIDWRWDARAPGLLVALALALGLAGCEDAGKGGPAVPVAAAAQAPPRPTAAPTAPSVTPPTAPAPKGNTACVRRGEVRRTVAAVGSFRARQTVRIGPQVSGRVQEVLVDVGDAVGKDQELVRLDRALFEIEAAQRRAELELARATQADAQLGFARMKALYEKPEGQSPSVPRKNYDDARLRLEETSARVHQAEEAVKWADQRLRETVIRSPFAGVVTRRLVDPGEPVTSAPVTHLLEIQEVAVLELEFSLPQELLARVRAGTPVEFAVEGTTAGARTGTVAVVFPDVDESTRSFRCRVVVEDAEGEYRPGLLAQVNVAVEVRKDVLVVPRAALAPAPGGGFQVQVSADGGTATRVVEVGLVTEEAAEIKAGVKEGEQVVLR